MKFYGIMLSMIKRVYKKTENSVYSLKAHVVFCTKYRRPVLTDGVDERLKEIIAEVCEERGVELIALEVMPEHVHLFVDVPPTISMSSLMHFVKGRASRLLRQEFPHLKSRLPCLWTGSFFCSSVGGAPVETVKRYIEEQQRYVRPKKKSQGETA